VQRVAIVDTGLCNVDSMWRAIEECGAKGDITADPADLAHADKIILPGVGAFPDAMAALRQHGLAEAIREQVLTEQIPVLGVCLGMQLLANSSDEVRRTRGLGLLDAHVERLVPIDPSERIPHVGWNEVQRTREHPVIAGLPDGVDCYFVHSFHMRCAEPADVLATTPYCGGFTSMVARGHIFGSQFHPEKSQSHGLRILRNFVGL
jgi:glutamine amidotransferase